MDILDKLNGTLQKVEQNKGVSDAHEFIDILKNNLRSKLGEKFIKIGFDADDEDGVVFVKFSKSSYKEATNEKLSSSTVNFIVAIDGFDGQGNLCDECGDFSVETINYYDPERQTRKLNRKSFNDINMAKNYITKYFESSVLNLDEDVSCAGGTSSGATSTAEGGRDNTVGSIAVKKDKLLTDIQRRGKIN